MNRAAYFRNQNICCQRDNLQMFAVVVVCLVVFVFCGGFFFFFFFFLEGGEGVRIAINCAFRNSFPHSPSRDLNGTQTLELAEILQVLNGKDHGF